MRSIYSSVPCRFRFLPAAMFFVAAVVVLRSPAPLDAQNPINQPINNVNNNNNNNNNFNNGYGFNQAVGGISIKSDGLIENASVDALCICAPHNDLSRKMLRRNKTPQAFPAAVQIELYQSLKQIRHDAGRLARAALCLSDQRLATKSRQNDLGALTPP